MGVEFGEVGVVVPLDGRLFQGAVHPLDLAVGPGVGHLGAAVLDAVFGTHGVEQVWRWALAMRQLRELHPVIGQYFMDEIRHRRHDAPPEIGGPYRRGFGVQLGEGQLAGAVDGDEKGEHQKVWGTAIV